jgi:hypothetical protein
MSYLDKIGEVVNISDHESGCRVNSSPNIAYDVDIVQF